MAEGETRQGAVPEPDDADLCSFEIPGYTDLPRAGRSESGLSLTQRNLIAAQPVAPRL